MGTGPAHPARPLLRARALQHREKQTQKQQRKEWQRDAARRRRRRRKKKKQGLAAPPEVWAAPSAPISPPSPPVRCHGQKHLAVLPAGGGEGAARQGHVSAAGDLCPPPRGHGALGGGYGCTPSCGCWRSPTRVRVEWGNGGGTPGAAPRGALNDSSSSMKGGRGGVGGHRGDPPGSPASAPRWGPRGDVLLGARIPT